MASFSDRRRFSSFFGTTIGRLILGWRARLREWTSPDRYRPEKHYMRGPGPKNAGKTGGGNSQAT